jgi:hypothetical protein
MSPAEIFYVGGMSFISVAFPTLLVGMWAWDRARPRAQAAHAPKSAAHAAPLRHAA